MEKESSKVVFDGYDIQSLKDITHASEQKVLNQKLCFQIT